MGLSTMHDLGAHTLIEGPAATSLGVDATFLNGASIDLVAKGNPQSAIALVQCGFTSASGASGGLNTLAAVVETDDNSSFTSATALITKAGVFTWVADGVNVGLFAFPVDLKAAEQYVRVKAKLTESGTITVSVQSMFVCLVIGGLHTIPHADYVAAGMSTLTEPS